MPKYSIVAGELNSRGQDARCLRHTGSERDDRERSPHRSAPSRWRHLDVRRRALCRGGSELDSLTRPRVAAHCGPRRWSDSCRFPPSANLDNQLAELGVSRASLWSHRPDVGLLLSAPSEHWSDFLDACGSAAHSVRLCRRAPWTMPECALQAELRTSPEGPQRASPAHRPTRAT